MDRSDSADTHITKLLSSSTMVKEQQVKAIWIFHWKSLLDPYGLLDSISLPYC